MRGERENNYANKAENEALDTNIHSHNRMSMGYKGSEKEERKKC